VGEFTVHHLIVGLDIAMIGKNHLVLGNDLAVGDISFVSLGAYCWWSGGVIGEEVYHIFVFGTEFGCVDVRGSK